MRLSALLLTALAGAAPALAADGPNVVTRVEVKAQGGATTLTIHGSRPPNFTTFSMVDPPRFVIDLAESTLQGVPEDSTVEDGTIRVVKCLAYGSGDTAIARIMIAFQRDVDPPDLKASGDDLVVTVGKPVAAAEVASAPAASPAPAPAAPAVEAPAAAAAAVASAAAGAAGAVSPAAAPPAASAAPAAEVAAVPVADEKARQERENDEVRAWKAARQREAELHGADENAKVTQLSAAAQAQEDARRAAEAEHGERAAAEARVRVAEAKVVRAEASGQKVAPEDAKALEDARLALAEIEARMAPPPALPAAPAAAALAVPALPEAKAEPPAVAAAPAAEPPAAAVAAAPAPAAELPAPAAAPALAAALEPPPAPAPAAASAAMPEPAAAAAPLVAAEEPRQEAKPEPKLSPKEARRQAAAQRKAEAEAKRKAEAEARRAAKAALAAEKAALAAEKPRVVREVGYRQLASASRVFVRLSDAPRFHIVEASEKLIRVELPNTRVVRRNDARFLDTSFFPGAVAMITPRPHGSTTVLEIALKQKVPYQQKVEGDVLALDFEQPAAAVAGATAP